MSVNVISVLVDQIMADPSQPRKTFLKDEIDLLAASIVARGILQPLRVIYDPERQRWRLVAGESRWRAAMQAGLTHVPCLPVEGELSEADILAEQIIENAVRSDIPPVQEARAIAKLKALTGSTSRELATSFGLSASRITRAEALLSLPEEVQQMVDDSLVPADSAYHLSRHPDGQAQLELARQVAAKSLSRDQVADVVRERLGGKAAKPKASRLTFQPAEGVCVSVTAVELSWDTLIAALDGCRKAAKKFSDSGEDISVFGKHTKG